LGEISIYDERKSNMKKSIVIIEILFIIGYLQSCGSTYTLGSPLKVTPKFTYTPSISENISNTITRTSTEYPTGKPDPTGQLLENGWYRFINYEAGYYIDYPPTATLHRESPGKILFSMADITFPRAIDPNGVVMSIFTYPVEENKSLDQFAEEEINHRLGRLSPEYIGNITKYSTVISDHQAIVVETTGFWRINVFIVTDEKFYSLFLAPNMMLAEGTTNEAVELFRSILLTFTILS
jgi:hypothetical protein